MASPCSRNLVVRQSIAWSRADAGNASPIRALAADELTLHDGNAEPGGTGAIGGGLTDRAGSDDDHVVKPLVTGQLGAVTRGRFC